MGSSINLEGEAHELLRHLTGDPTAAFRPDQLEAILTLDGSGGTWSGASEASNTATGRSQYGEATVKAPATRRFSSWVLWQFTPLKT